MSTLVNEKIEVKAQRVRFVGDLLILELSDGRNISLPMEKIKWLAWLLKATPEQRGKWSILPHGYGVYWEELDDGFEVEHALSTAELV
ncbi:MAG: DUF2442 domain-containing protein [Chloroflexi bacterium]|nr:DUF2442 domain-containing protein [Chloroflexota bacterium]